jgi:hypothetical protein
MLKDETAKKKNSILKKDKKRLETIRVNLPNLRSKL